MTWVRLWSSQEHHIGHTSFPDRSFYSVHIFSIYFTCHLSIMSGQLGKPSSNSETKSTPEWGWVSLDTSISGHLNVNNINCDIRLCILLSVKYFARSPFYDRHILLAPSDPVEVKGKRNYNPSPIHSFRLLLGPESVNRQAYTAYSRYASWGTAVISLKTKYNLMIRTQVNAL